MISQPIDKVAYSPSEAADALGLGLTRFREIVDRGDIKVFRVGRRVLIRKSDLEAFANRLFDEQHSGGAVCPR
jgi:excisionase family DNA binding protein